MASTASSPQPADLVLLHPGRDEPVDVGAVRALVDQGAAVVAVQVPEVGPDGGLDREALAACHHQCGVDLARLSERLQLRDIVLLKLPHDADGRSRMALLHVWTSERSHYDIEAVRIPWDQLPGKRDYRNNPRGKNPTNVWAFRGALDGGSDGVDRGHATSLHIEAAAIRWLVRCHASDGAVVHVAASEYDAALIRQVVCGVGRRFAALPDGAPDPREPVPLEVELPAVAAVPEAESVEHVFSDPASGEVRCTATARFVDCREGLRSMGRGRVTHAVTSPPYNIGYDPFNVAVRDPRTGELVPPERRGYEDELSPAQYAGLLQGTFAALDEAADPGGFELFLNIKNNYKQGRCLPPFYMLRLMPARWRLLDLLVWRYDISFDPARRKYKPVYEWVIRVGFGVPAPLQPMADWYVPILKGNSRERRELSHPAMFPRQLVHRALEASGREVGLVVDPFLGSGTTLAACAELGVDSVGFEVRAEYGDDVVRRLGWVRETGSVRD